MHPWALLREGLICLRGVCAGLLVVCRRARGVAPQKREGNALYTDGAVGRAVLKSLFCEKRASERVSTESIKPLISMGGETRQMSASLSLTAPHTQTPYPLSPPPRASAATFCRRQYGCALQLFILRSKCIILSWHSSHAHPLVY